MKNAILVGGSIGLLLVLVVGAALWNTESRPDYSALSPREVAMLCTTDMATQFHIHPHLDIIINGVPQVIPANTGILNEGTAAECMHSLHTHDTSGTLHVESPVQKDFTLGDFFAVWGKTFTKHQILDYKTNATYEITVTVNGKPVDTYENTVLRDLDRIVITYGS